MGPASTASPPDFAPLTRGHDPPPSKRTGSGPGQGACEISAGARDPLNPAGAVFDPASTRATVAIPMARARSSKRGDVSEASSRQSIGVPASRSSASGALHSRGHLIGTRAAKLIIAAVVTAMPASYRATHDSGTTRLCRMLHDCRETPGLAGRAVARSAGHLSSPGHGRICGSVQSRSRGGVPRCGARSRRVEAGQSVAPRRTVADGVAAVPSISGIVVPW